MEKSLEEYKADFEEEYGYPQEEAYLHAEEEDKKMYQERKEMIQEVIEKIQEADEALWASEAIFDNTAFHLKKAIENLKIILRLSRYQVAMANGELGKILNMAGLSNKEIHKIIDQN